MEKSRLFLLGINLITAFSGIVAQTFNPGKYFVKFTDKVGSTYSISNPSAFLSTKAIARRTKNTYPITVEDLPVNSNYISGVQAAGGLTFARSKWYNGVVTQINSQAVYNALAALPYVQNLKRIAFRKNIKVPYAKDDIEAQGLNMIQQNIANAKLNSTDRFQYGSSYNQVDMIGGVCMHNKGFDGTGTTIVILDSGFENADVMTAFDSARMESRIVKTYDFVNMDTLVYEDHNHGANVFSCIGANVPNTLVGTAPKAKFYLCRTEDVASEYPVEEYNWVAGLEYADSVGADVVNSSLGYTEFTDPIYNHVRADLNGRTSPASNATSLAARRGLVVCNSAGNEGNSPWFYIGVPADGDSMLAVGAVNASRIKVGFSSFGPSADGRVKPDVAAQGGNTFLAYTFNNIFGTASGTSFSSPLMAGMVACLIQSHPNSTAMQIMNAIKQSSHQYNTPDSLLGYGIPNFCKADSILSGLTTVANHLSFKNEVKIYPNPFQDELLLTIHTNAIKENISVKILDVLGKEVRKENYFPLSQKNDIVINTSDLDKGTYTFLIQLSNEVKSYILIKQ
jgi:serine protease AprX